LPEEMKMTRFLHSLSCSAIVLSACLASPAFGQLPSVPGYFVSVFVSKSCSSGDGSGLCPTTIAWASPSLAYCGRDIRYCPTGTNPLAATYIGKITSSDITGSFSPYPSSSTAIGDPDAVCVDTAGKFAAAGSVLVGGRVPAVSRDDQGSKITAIQPNGTLKTVLATPNGLWDPSAMAFDSAGRLLVCDTAGNFSSAASKIVRIDKNSGTGAVTMTTLFKAPNAPNHRFLDMAVAPEGIYAGDTRGVVALYDYSGNVIRTLVTGLHPPINIARAPGGFFGTDVYALDGYNTLRRLTGGGAPIIGSGFGESPSLSFGPDGAMYVPEIANNRILRIGGEILTIDPLPDMLGIPNTPGQCNATVALPVPTTHGGCPPITISYSPKGPFPVGSTGVTCTAHDTCGQSASRTFTVQVVDNEPPVIAPHDPVVIGNDPGKCSAIVSYTAIATDNCGVARIVFTPPSGSVFLKGLNTVTCTATDVHGNSSSRPFTVTINDTEKPVISCPGDITVPSEPGKCTAKVNFAVLATDNCDNPPLSTITPPPGSVFGPGTTTVTATAIDTSGNKATCQFRVTVTVPDCNGNGLCDFDDIASGRSKDCNGNGIPDECEIRKAKNVDLVFIVDTSPSMDDEASALCGHISDVLADLASVGIQVNAQFYGITEGPKARFACLTGNVRSLFGSTVPGSTTLTLRNYESWGPATSIVAALYGWRQGVTRVIVPISDEGAYEGDPCDDPGLDRDAITNACANAKGNEVVVCPVLGTPGGNDQTCTWQLMQDLASCSGGTAFHTTDPGSDLAMAIFRAVIRAGGFGDCNGNGVLDSCEIAAGTLHDCNADGIPDECEIASGLVPDVNHNGIPDECEVIINQQPSDLSVVELSNASFSVTATAAKPLTYRWQKNGADINDTTNITGARSATLQIGLARKADAGAYSVVVSDGVTSTTSRSATLAVSLYGDANTDGTVDTADVVRILRASAGMEKGSGYVILGDVAPFPSARPAGFGNARMDLQDGIRLMRHITGLDNNPPWR
jgi:hypothetical protein